MNAITLQSEDHRDLLDLIDSLRSKGLNKYVDLPEIIVCGDQSAGKSSVLEAISGFSFPAKDNLCTQFATEVILRRQAASAVGVSITPGPERNDPEKEVLKQFNVNLDLVESDLGAVVKMAKEAMGLSSTKVFSTDTLRVELCGPTHPHLTMVDLPGLFRAGNSSQSVTDAAIVRNMVRSYVQRPRSIILAVVSAKSDFALQEITEMARELDPSGVRTLGLITKPDTLDAGSDSEAAYIKLAQNQDVAFRLGWHVLKNRDYNMKETSSAERDEAEDAFFGRGNWANVERNSVGVKALKPKLSAILKDQILQQLPSLISDIESEIGSCVLELQHLGDARVTVAQQRKYLLHISDLFTRLMTDAIAGKYDNPFFGSATDPSNYKKRARARVQNTLVEFEECLRLDGQEQKIVETESEKQKDKGQRRRVSRADYRAQVKALMKMNRGCELPGTFDPSIIGELFHSQCKPWREITQSARDDLFRIALEVTDEVVHYVAAAETSNAILVKIKSTLDELGEDLDKALELVLEVSHSFHPITYNHYLTDTVQNAQKTRQKEKMSELISACTSKKGHFEPQSLMVHLETHPIVNMEDFASDLAIDYLQAYYKVRPATKG